MQLTNYNALGTVDDEGALRCHVRNLAKENVGNLGREILMVRISTVEFQLGLERHIVGQTAEQALLDRIAGRINVVVEKRQHVVVACVGNGEILGENFVKTLLLAILWRRIELQEVVEGLELDVEEVRIGKRSLRG
jgi:hypothetical protein